MPQVYIWISIGCTFFISGYFVFRYWQRIQQNKQLSISASGEMVLLLQPQQDMQKNTHGSEVGTLTGLNVRLSHKSRIWAYFLSIFLIDEAGKEHKLLILPDSLSPAAFQALRVSLIWISQHNAG